MQEVTLKKTGITLRERKEKEKVSLLVIYLLVIPSSVFRTNSCHTKEAALTTNPLSIGVLA